MNQHIKCHFWYQQQSVCRLSHVIKSAAFSLSPAHATAGYTFPYLYDESQEVAKAYKAACTPEFYVFNAGLQLVYHGQFDDSRPKNNAPVTGNVVQNVIYALPY